MKCGFCGQEIERKPTNFEKLKTCRNEKEVENFISEICHENCPFGEWCPEVGCRLDRFVSWLFEEAE